MATKKKAAPKRGASRYQAPAKKPVPGWIWLVCGLLIGGLLVTLANLEPGRDDIRRDRGETRASTTNKPTQAPTTTPAQRPKYEFYTLLPESEVSTPSNAQPAPVTTPTPAPVTPEQAAKIDQARAEAALAGQVPPPAPPVVQPAPAVKPEASAPSSQFYLQAGSFRQSTEADRVRAQILLLGQNARIEASKVNNDTWHRVMIGPFSSREQMNAAQRELAGSGFSNLLPQQR